MFLKLKLFYRRKKFKLQKTELFKKNIQQNYNRGQYTRHVLYKKNE